MRLLVRITFVSCLCISCLSDALYSINTDCIVLLSSVECCGLSVVMFFMFIMLAWFIRRVE